MIGYVYHNGGANTKNQDLGIKVAHSIGTFFGQLLFGFLADHVGRKRMYGIELVCGFKQFQRSSLTRQLISMFSGFR